MQLVTGGGLTVDVLGDGLLGMRITRPDGSMPGEDVYATLDPAADQVLSIGPSTAPGTVGGAAHPAAGNHARVRRLVRRTARARARTRARTRVGVSGCVALVALGPWAPRDRRPRPRPCAGEMGSARQKYVRFVERHRKLEFEHPVPVKFLDDDAFVKAYQRDDPKITKEDRADAERSAGQLRALGLVEGPVDLIESQKDLAATDTVGFYDQERKALFVRGTDLTDVDVRITLVHELTHALQDQRFDLTRLDDAIETSGEDFALTALVEGDATSVEDDYLYSLPQTDQDAYFAEAPDRPASPPWTRRPSRPTSRPCSTSSRAGRTCSAPATSRCCATWAG